MGRVRDIIEARFGNGTPDGLFSRAFIQIGTGENEDTHYLLLDLTGKMRGLAMSYLTGDISDDELRQYHNEATASLSRANIEPKMDADTFINEFKKDRVEVTLFRS